jgi:hypothetical protein
MSKFCVEVTLLIFLLSQVIASTSVSGSDVEAKARKIITYDYFYRSEMKIDYQMEMTAPSLPKLILIVLDGLTLDHLKNYTLPNINRYFQQEGVILHDERRSRDIPLNKLNGIF